MKIKKKHSKKSDAKNVTISCDWVECECECVCVCVRVSTLVHDLLELHLTLEQVLWSNCLSSCRTCFIWLTFEAIFRLVMISRGSLKLSPLTTKCGGGYVWPPSLTFVCFELFDWFFFEPVGNLLLIQGKLLRISNLLFRLKYLPKTLFFALPPPPLGSVAQTTHAWKFCSCQTFWP